MFPKTAERRFGFKFEEAIKARSLNHQVLCNCFPCRAFSQWQDFTGNNVEGDAETKAFAKSLHDPEHEKCKRFIKNAHPDTYVIWNGCVFFVA